MDQFVLICSVCGKDFEADKETIIMCEKCERDSEEYWKSYFEELAFQEIQDTKKD